MILLYISILIFLLIITALFLGFFNVVKKNIIKLYSKMLIKLKFVKKIIILSKVFLNAFKNLKYSQSLMIEFIFQLFIYFYENTLHEIENVWKFESEYFPQGKTNLYEMYKWIKKIRISNYEDFKNLILSEENDFIICEGQKFEDFIFKVKPNGVIDIIPLIHKESIKEIKDNYFQLKFLKLQNVLYELDIEKTKWILEHQKFLGI